MSDKDKNPVDTETAIEDKNGQNVEEENDRILLSKEVLQTDDDLSEMGSWMLETLRKQQPDAEITLSSVQALTDMLDGITTRVLEEAKKISQGGEGDGWTPTVATSLTSLDIHKALKRLLPGEPGDPLRPYLPAVTKQAWHLDKQSLKGIKKQKGSGGGAVAVAVGGQALPPPGPSQQPQQTMATAQEEENVPPL